MADSHRPPHRVLRRALPAVLAAVTATVACSSGDDVRPAPSASTTLATTPAEAMPTADPTTTAAAGSPAATSRPVETTRPVQTTRPMQTSRPVETTTPAVETTTPAEEGSRAEAGTPAVATLDTSAPAAEAVPAPAPLPVAVDEVAVLAALDAAASTAGGTIAAVVLDGNGTELVATPDAGEPRYTASLVKLLVVQQLLARDAARVIALTEDDTALMQRALTVSDDRAMSLLWDRWDGAELVTTAVTQFGLTGTRLPGEPGQWGEAVTTARDQATFLSELDTWLTREATATMTSWLQGTTDRAADGFAQDFGLLSPTAGTADPIAAKQGWMCCLDSGRQLHSVGVLADGRVVVLLGDFPLGTGWTQARAALDAAARAVVTGT